jgi:hypothetical protein
MPLTESFKKRIFGNTEPQQQRDYSGPGNTLLYEGYATPGIKTSTAGYVIVKHSFDVNNMDIESQPKVGLIWDLRSVYDYTNP